MSVNINASTTNGLVLTSDTSGEIKLQANGADIATVDSSGITMASGKTLPASALTGTLPSGTNVISTGTSVASTSGTSIDFTSIPSWVKRITVILNGVSTNGGDLPQIQLGTSGGIVTSGYLGSQSYLAGSSGATNLTTGLPTGQAASSNHIRHGMVIITNITGNIWTSLAMIGLSNQAELGLGCGSITLSGTLDRLRITTTGGTDTFDAGNINILYE